MFTERIDVALGPEAEVKVAVPQRIVDFRDALYLNFQEGGQELSVRLENPLAARAAALQIIRATDALAGETPMRVVA